jgi:RNA polymerase sigma-70 factor (ECF subfamily)
MTDLDSDDALVRAAQSGDEAAFRALVLAYQNKIFSFIMRQVRARELAEELAQEVFVKAYRNLVQFRGEALFRTWLFRIAVNTTQTYFSSRAHRAERMTVSVELVDGGNQAPDESFLSSFGSPDEELLRRERLTWFAECMQKLGDEMRQVLALVGLEHHSYEEVAQVMQVPVGTVRSRLNRARLLVKDCLLRRGALS